MNIRIDIESEGSVIVLHVAGHLDRTSIEQLTDVFESMEGNVALVLSELIFADDAGAEALRTLYEKGADIREASSFMRLLIDGKSPNRTD